MHSLWAAAAVTATLGAALLMPPIRQPVSYHDFADQRTYFGVPHFWDVASNLVFAAAGLAGLRTSPRLRDARAAFLTLFTGVLLTAAGSMFYHWSPSDDTLFWDRLPMTIAFMSLLAAVMEERLQLHWLLPLVVAGAASAVWWKISGDLRFYLVVQGASLLTVACMILLIPSRTPGTRWLWAGLGLYALSKLCEGLDREIFAFGQWVSGHTLKHLSAGAGCLALVRMVEMRLRP